jgi:hypothetical protein
MIPFGIAVLAMTVAALGASIHALAYVGAIIFVVASMVGVGFMIRPPRWIKPAWAREADVGMEGSLSG